MDKDFLVALGIVRIGMMTTWVEFVGWAGVTMDGWSKAQFLRLDDRPVSLWCG